MKKSAEKTTKSIKDKFHRKTNSLLMLAQSGWKKLHDVFLPKLKKSRLLHGKNKFFLIGAAILFCIILILNVVIQVRKRAEGLITYEVKRQDLVISVIEGGNLKALRFQKIVNEVPGQRAILEVVDEGITITEKDVEDSKTLMKLDSKDLEDRIEELKISVESSWAAYVQAQQNLEIQKKQNESDIKQAELEVKFAKMDLEKYLGKELAKKLIENEEGISFSELIESSELEGEALARKREVENEIDLAKEEVARARDTVDWSKKLAEKDYLTKSELEADRFSLQQKEVAIENARLEYQLFLNYDFPKQVEKLLSDYNESLNELERTKARCESEIIKYETDVSSKRASYLERKNNLEKTEKELSQCTIVATQTGLVTYATSSRPWQSDDPIQPGTSVRHRQELLNIPDLSSMGVEVRIHESSIKQVKVGQRTIVRVDAVSGERFTGEVKKVSPLPDATFKWMNPDLNVYVVEVALNEKSDFSKLTPGMSAEVEIIVEKLQDVLAVPLASISFREEQPNCAVLRGMSIDMRDVELGKSNEEMVEVKSGLREGELVAMLPGEMEYQVQKTSTEEKGRFEKGQEEKSQN